MDNNVLICIDLIKATGGLKDIGQSMVEIVVEHDFKKYFKKLNIIKDNMIQPLEIEENLRINSNNEEYPAVVSISLDGKELLRREISINRSKVGILKICCEISILVAFRVINESRDGFEIYEMNEIQLEDYKMIRIVDNQSKFDTFLSEDKRNHLHLMKKFKYAADIRKQDDYVIKDIVLHLILPEHPCLVALEGYINTDDGIILVFDADSVQSISAINLHQLCDDEKARLLFCLFSCFSFLNNEGFSNLSICSSNVLIFNNFEIKIISFNDFLSKNKCLTLLTDFIRTDFDVILNELGSSDLFIQFLKISLTSGNNDHRISYSEVCNLIESDRIYQVSEKSCNYFEKLSIYNKPEPLRDFIVSDLVDYYIQHQDFNIYCDLLKLQANTYSNGDKFFDFFVFIYDGVALNLEHYFDLSNNCHHFQHLKYSEEKFEKIIEFSSKFTNRYFARIYLDTILKTNSFQEKYFWMLYEQIIEYSMTGKAPDIFVELLSFNEGAELFLDYIYCSLEKENKIHLLKDLSNWFIFIMKITKSVNPYAFEFIFRAQEYFINLDSSESFDQVILINEALGDDRKVQKITKNAVKSGYNNYLYPLGEIYYKKGNLDKALKYYKMAAKIGESNAMLKVAMILLDGNKGEEMIKEGIEYLKLCADTGNPEAQSQLAYMYLFGIHIPKDYPHAFWYCFHSYDQGCKSSYCAAGLINFHGIIKNVDYTQARYCFENCEGEYRNIALYHLALIHLCGLDISVDILRAHQYYWEVTDKSIKNKIVISIVDYDTMSNSYRIVGFGEKKFISRDELIKYLIQMP